MNHFLGNNRSAVVAGFFKVWPHEIQRLLESWTNVYTILISYIHWHGPNSLYPLLTTVLDSFSW